MKNIIFTITMVCLYSHANAQTGESEYVKVNLPSKKANTNQSIPAQSIATVSDVDMGVTASSKTQANRYALIIGNEDYSSFQKGLDKEADVDFARNDAKTFSEYAVKLLGVPEENIVLLLDAKLIEMRRALDKIENIIKSLDGQAEVIFYYAGHGLPEEASKEAYIMPVDVSGADIQYAIKTQELYDKLTKYPAKRVSVFLDACFSGGGRNQGLVSARAAKIKPKNNLVNQGNLFVLSAANETQTALPYKEKGHGLYTYYLLKILKTTQGDISYEEMAAYVQKQTTINSVMVNSKEQNPQTIVSPYIESSWKTWKVNE
jgi:uncharacterized caspase-like protein